MLSCTLLLFLAICILENSKNQFFVICNPPLAELVSQSYHQKHTVPTYASVSHSFITSRQYGAANMKSKSTRTRVPLNSVLARLIVVASAAYRRLLDALSPLSTPTTPLAT